MPSLSITFIFICRRFETRMGISKTRKGSQVLLPDIRFRMRVKSNKNG